MPLVLCRFSPAVLNRGGEGLEENMPQDDAPIFDFDSAAIKRMVIELVKNLRGKWYFHWHRCLKDKTPKQLGYLWGSVYVDVCSAILEAWGESITVDEAHEICKRLFWTKPIVDRKTGELKHTLTMSLSTMDVVDMAGYIDKIGLWLSESLNFEMRPPDPTLSREFKAAIAAMEKK